MNKEELAEILKKNPDLAIASGDMIDKPIKSKYNAVKTEYKGVKYDSKAEAHYAIDLDMLKLNGKVSFWLRQVPFTLPGNVTYKCDFQVFYADGHIEFVDVKGMKTDIYRLKKKQVEALYPVKIIEVK
jgi:hypothetical protein